MRKIWLLGVLGCLFFGQLFSPTLASTLRKHPHHQAIVWTTRFEGAIFRVIKFPNCRHVETIITNNPPGETKEKAKKRLKGFAACTGCFYNTETLQPVDFFRRYGKIYIGREVGRKILAIPKEGPICIADDYQDILSKPEIDALALGSLVKPFSLDGFPNSFANIDTDRMALAISPKYLYIIQARTNLWQLGQFIKQRLPCDKAINTDGGHSVKGKSPFHLVFRWKKPAKVKLKP